MQTTGDFLLVSEAAEFLGVSPNTIRNWGRDGKITEYRHPINNYRMFRLQELERLRKRLESPRPSKPR
jgi:DNA (cytosine-5)-methyltransferase 1